MYPGVRNTGEMTPVTVGMDARTFSFYNKQDPVPPTGINDNAWGTASMALVAALAAAMGCMAVVLIKRKLYMAASTTLSGAM